MYSWVFLKSDDWAKARDLREKQLTERQRKTVDHVLHAVLHRPDAFVAPPVWVRRSGAHDSFLAGDGAGDGADPLALLRDLQSQRSQLFTEEELLVQEVRPQVKITEQLLPQDL